jgi:hypothetical protein
MLINSADILFFITLMPVIKYIVGFLLFLFCLQM